MYLSKVNWKLMLWNLSLAPETTPSVVVISVLIAQDPSGFCLLSGGVHSVRPRTEYKGRVRKEPN